MCSYEPLNIPALEIFLISDQPTTCPKCGVRTEIILSITKSDLIAEVNACLSSRCRFIFLTSEN